MSGHAMILITGRTTKQGSSLHLGKDSEKYVEEVRKIQMNARDIQARGLTPGEEVEVKSEAGQTVVRLEASESLPDGIAFMPYGPWSSQLIPDDTHGTGMPSSKGVSIRVARPPAEES